MFYETKHSLIYAVCGLFEHQVFIKMGTNLWRLLVKG